MKGTERVEQSFHKTLKTMDLSSQAINGDSDQKLNHLQTPQTPIVSTNTYEPYCNGYLPAGTNAVMAVLAYSGYTMEDAMLLHKACVDREMSRGHIHQTETIRLAELIGKADQGQKEMKM